MKKAIPNMISIARICLVPVFIAVYFAFDNEIKFWAIIVYAIAGISDLLDGYLARKFDAVSKLGKLLDPLGDKLMTFTVLVCITITRPILYWAVLVFFVKEVLMGIGGFLIHKKARVELPAANFIGKTSTFLLFLVCVTMMLFRELPDYVVIGLTTAAICVTLVALASYLNSYIKIMKSKPIENNNGEIECNQQSVQDVNETRQ